MTVAEDSDAYFAIFFWCGELKLIDHQSTRGRRNMNHRAIVHCTDTNFTQTAPNFENLPVGVNRPVFWSIRNTTMLSDFWLAANRSVPVGSISKLRGSLPPV